MSSMTIGLGGDNYLTTGGVCTGIHFGDGTANHFDIDMLGGIAEWLAVAWENVAGEEYKPVIIAERGYVADEGMIGNSESAIKKRAARLELFQDKLERDCE